MKRLRIILIFSVLFISATFVAHAQGGAQGGSTNGPIDGGAVALLIGAAAYGYRKMQKGEKTEK